jgi:hypothetical protein
MGKFRYPILAPGAFVEALGEPRVVIWSAQEVGRPNKYAVYGSLPCGTSECGSYDGFREADILKGRVIPIGDPVFYSVALALKNSASDVFSVGEDSYSAGDLLIELAAAGLSEFRHKHGSDVVHLLLAKCGCKDLRMQALIMKSCAHFYNSGIVDFGGCENALHGGFFAELIKTKKEGRYK